MSSQLAVAASSAPSGSVSESPFKVPALPSRARPARLPPAAASEPAPASAVQPSPASSSSSSAVSSPSAQPYTPPLWTSIAVHPYSLSVIRRGSLLSSISLTAHPYYTIGRLPAPSPSSSHISLLHPSVSRCHAVLQHRDDGRVYLQDRQSAHGTAVNKRRLPAGHWLELRVGDQMRFGESERLFVLEGPDDLRLPEQERRERRRRVTALTQAQRLQSQREEKEEKEETSSEDGSNPRPPQQETEEFATWGMQDDAAEEDDDSGDPAAASSSALYDRVELQLMSSSSSSSLSASDLSSLTPKQREALQRLERRRQKLLNLQQEIDAITAKEGKQDAGLTEGQQKQREKNEQRIQEMTQQMTEDMDSLRQLLGGGEDDAQHSGSRRRTAGGSDDERGGDDSDDDLYDRTLTQTQTAASTPHAAAASASSVSAVSGLPPVASLHSVSDIRGQLRRCEEMRDALRVVLRDLSSSASSASSADSLELYMQQVEDERRSARRNDVKQQLRDLQSYYLQLEARLTEKDAAAKAEQYRLHGAAAFTAERRPEDETPSTVRASSHEEQQERTEEKETENGRELQSAPSASASGGSVAEALARVRRKQAETAGEVQPASSRSTTRAPIGPQLPPASSASAAASASPPAAAAPTAASFPSSAVSELARRLDASRAAKRSVGGAESAAAISGVLKRRMEGDGEGGGGGLLLRAVEKRQKAHSSSGSGSRDSGEVEDGSDAAASAADLSWTPPVNQSGDGRTERNARLGY